MSEPYVHFVAANDGWVLERMAHDFASRMGQAGVGPVPNPNADCNVYMPYYLFGDKTKRDVCLFTHLEDARDGEAAALKAAYFHQCAARADVCWAMSDRTACELLRHNPVVIKPPPSEDFRISCLDLGFVGIEQPFGRKNFGWIEQLQAIPGVSCHWTNGQIPQDKMADWYRDVDYTVIVSNNEGGPMPVVESLACGTPVIAPDVGWAWDYPVLRYDGVDELVHLIRGLTFGPDLWDNAVAQLKELCLPTE